jgi:hypothetical protein
MSDHQDDAGMLEQRMQSTPSPSSFAPRTNLVAQWKAVLEDTDAYMDDGGSADRELSRSLLSPQSWWDVFRDDFLGTVTFRIAGCIALHACMCVWLCKLRN